MQKCKSKNKIKKYQIRKREEIKCNNIIRQYEIYQLLLYYKKNIQEHHLNSPHILDHPHRILIDEGQRSGKRTALLNLIESDDHYNKIYLYLNDSKEAKH